MKTFRRNSFPALWAALAGAALLFSGGSCKMALEGAQLQEAQSPFLDAGLLSPLTFFNPDTLNPPTRIKITDFMKDRVQLEWGMEPIATHYRIYRSNAPEGPFTQIGEDQPAKNTGDNPAQNEQFTDTVSIQKSQYYYYRLTSVKALADGTKIESGFSAVVKAFAYSSADDTLLPPQRISVSQGDYPDKITVSWEPVPTADGYLLYYSNTGTLTPDLSQRGFEEEWQLLNNGKPIPPPADPNALVLSFEHTASATPPLSSDAPAHFYCLQSITTDNELPTGNMDSLSPRSPAYQGFLADAAVPTVTDFRVSFQENPVHPNQPPANPDPNNPTAPFADKIRLQWKPVGLKNQYSYAVSRCDTEDGIYLPLPLPNEGIFSADITGYCTFDDTDPWIVDEKNHYYRIKAIKMRGETPVATGRISEPKKGSVIKEFPQILVPPTPFLFDLTQYENNGEDGKTKFVNPEVQTLDNLAGLNKLNRFLKLRYVQSENKQVPFTSVNDLHYGDRFTICYELSDLAGFVATAELEVQAVAFIDPQSSITLKSYFQGASLYDTAYFTDETIVLEYKEESDLKYYSGTPLVKKSFTLFKENPNGEPPTEIKTVDIPSVTENSAVLDLSTLSSVLNLNERNRLSFRLFLETAVSDEEGNRQPVDHALLTQQQFFDLFPSTIPVPNGSFEASPDSIAPWTWDIDFAYYPTKYITTKKWTTDNPSLSNASGSYTEKKEPIVGIAPGNGTPRSAAVFNTSAETGGAVDAEILETVGTLTSPEIPLFFLPSRNDPKAKNRTYHFSCMVLRDYLHTTDVTVKLFIPADSAQPILLPVPKAAGWHSLETDIASYADVPIKIQLFKGTDWTTSDEGQVQLDEVRITSVPIHP